MRIAASVRVAPLLNPNQSAGSKDLSLAGVQGAEPPGLLPSASDQPAARLRRRLVPVR